MHTDHFESDDYTWTNLGVIHNIVFCYWKTFFQGNSLTTVLLSTLFITGNYLILDDYNFIQTIEKYHF